MDQADQSRSIEWTRTDAGQKVLAERFVAQWLVPGKRSVQLSWVKVVAECEASAEFSPERIWIAQKAVEAALVAAGYKLRRSKADAREVYVYAALNSRHLDQQRFFHRGGRWPRPGRKP